jgi:hypothetical protein
MTDTELRDMAAAANSARPPVAIDAQRPTDGGLAGGQRDGRTRAHLQRRPSVDDLEGLTASPTPGQVTVKTPVSIFFSAGAGAGAGCRRRSPPKGPTDPLGDPSILA